jgi:cell division protein FtsW
MIQTLAARIHARDLLLSCVFILLAFSAVMVFSASAFHRSVEGDAFFFLRRHVLWLPIAALVGLLFSEVDYRLFRRYYPHIMAAAVVLLALVLLPQLGRYVNQSRRWLPLGGLQFQPSEFAKLAIIIFVAGFLASDPGRARRFFTGFLPVCMTTLVVFALILIEPDLGSSLFVLGLAGVLMVLGGMRLWYLLVVAATFAPLLIYFARKRWETVLTRFEGMFDPENVYQVKHSLRALGSGGWFGMGLGAGGQKLSYLPESHTDFVLAVIGEELGFAGCAAVILVFLVLVWSGAAIARGAPDRFGFLLAAGITLSLGVQAAINIAVVTGSAPTKGMPLPFLSFGGSGLCMTLAEIGILMSIAAASREAAREEAT